MSEDASWGHISVNHLVVPGDGATGIELEHDHLKFVRVLKPWLLETGRANTL